MTDHVTTHQAEDDARNEAILIWVNGKIVPKAQATVSVYDSGFMLGDGVWEGVRLYNGRWTFMDEHIDRLFEAAKAIDLDIGMTKAQVTQALLDTQAANGLTTDAHARLMVTRGIENPPVPAPVAVALRADDGHHHGTFAPENPAPDPACHRAAPARLADDTRPKTQLSFQS